MSRQPEVMSTEEKVIVLLSGGVDSVTALYDACARCRVAACLSFHYGSKHNDRELPFARYHSERLGIDHSVVDLAFIGEHFKSALLGSGGDIPNSQDDVESMRATVVPFRNAIMLSIATGLAASLDASAVVIGAHAGDHAVYPDCRPEFMRAMEQAMAAGTYEKIGLQRPFIERSKAEIVGRGHELGVDFRQTWSCYEGGDLHCGVCGTCRDRLAAFKVAGFEDPAEYVSSKPWNFSG